MPTTRRDFLQLAALGLAGAVLAPSEALASLPGRQNESPANSIDVISGTLEAIGDGWIDIVQDEQVRRLLWNGNSSFWKGGEGSVNTFRKGDDVMFRVLADSGLILRGWANLGRVSGEIVRREKDGFILKLTGNRESLLRIKDGAVGKDFFTGRSIHAARTDIQEGDFIDAIGEMTPDGLLATLFAHGNPSDARTKTQPVKKGPDKVDRQGIISPLVQCKYTYTGTATWFYCSGGQGRCSTCSSSRTDQIAWPAMDDSCDCCSFECANCSKGCKNQVYLSCGQAVTITDLCGNRTKTFYIADAGPCQQANCDGCSPQVCGRVCADCLGYNTPIVDLTRQSFALWYDPAAQGCFSCEVYVIIPC